MTGRIIAKGPHQCEPSNAFASCGDIWQCNDCGRTWRCTYVTMRCGSCGVMFALDDDFIADRQRRSEDQ